MYKNRLSTGVFSPVAARVVDCATGAVAVDSFSMVQCTRDIIYKVMNSNMNIAIYPKPSDIYRGN
jgi:hypothetical protein